MNSYPRHQRCRVPWVVNILQGIINVHLGYVVIFSELKKIYMKIFKDRNDFRLFFCLGSSAPGKVKFSGEILRDHIGTGNALMWDF